MRGYRICGDVQGWYFQLIPMNNCQQPIGQSISCSSEQECRELLDKIRTIVLENSKLSADNCGISVVKNDGRWRCVVTDGESILFQSRKYFGNSSKKNSLKCMQMLQKYIHEYTKREV